MINLCPSFWFCIQYLLPSAANYSKGLERVFGACQIDGYLLPYISRNSTKFLGASV